MRRKDKREKAPLVKKKGDKIKCRKRPGKWKEIWKKKGLKQIFGKTKSNKKASLTKERKKKKKKNEKQQEREKEEEKQDKDYKRV